MEEKVKKVLEKQLELLSEQSKTCTDSDLLEITKSMCLLADYLSDSRLSNV